VNSGAGEVAGVLLAAGQGSRLGMPKALVRVEGQALSERGVRTLSAGGCRPVLVVLGAAAGEVLTSCDLDDAVVVMNENWAEGLGSSVRAGLEEAERSGASAALMMPVDQPFVSPKLVERLVDAWREGAQAAVASFAGDPGTPVLLDRSIWPRAISVAVGDMGARALLRSNPDLVTLGACDDVGQVFDIDTAEDLREWERRRSAAP